MTHKYPLPDCLKQLRVPEPDFRHWLDRKAQVHVNRDKRRGVSSGGKASYKERICQAVNEAQGRDYYTGQRLAWNLISRWDNAEAARKKGEYKRDFWNLPTVDHEDPSDCKSTLRLCSWRLNDAKNDQTIAELLALADQIRAHQRTTCKS
jgi:hypothetical protein